MSGPSDIGYPALGPLYGDKDRRETQDVERL
jgi:hypothetical protein